MEEESKLSDMTLNFRWKWRSEDKVQELRRLSGKSDGYREHGRTFLGPLFLVFAAMQELSPAL